jgi:hypothetical protein
MAALLLALPIAIPAADDPRVSFLEQEVRNLQREVQALKRRVDELSRPMVRNPEHRTPTGPEQRVGDAPTWVDAAKWRQVRPGMSELQVVALLGPPTSMRAEGDVWVLLYALEIGTTHFLGGSVRLRERAVTEVRAPALQ